MEDNKNLQLSDDESGIIQLRKKPQSNKTKTTTTSSKSVVIDNVDNSRTIDVTDIDSLLAALDHTRNSIDQNNDILTIKNSNSATVQVCCAQSGYIANMAPLNYNEFFKMANSEESNYESKKLTYKTIFDKIASTSVSDWNLNDPKSFEDWLRSTSVYDMETLCYGIFCATYQNEGKYQYMCPHCHTLLDTTLTHDKIIHTADAKAMELLIEDITKNSTDIEEMKRLSLVLAKHETIQTPSGIIFELKIPSLYDMLALIRSFTDEELEEMDDGNEKFVLTMLLSIESVFIPVPNKNKYTRLTKKKDIRYLLNNIPVIDIIKIREAVLNSIKKNHITYSIRNVKCTNPKCSNPDEEKIIPFVPLNLEEILFAHIASLI